MGNIKNRNKKWSRRQILLKMKRISAVRLRRKLLQPNEQNNHPSLSTFDEDNDEGLPSSSTACAQDAPQPPATPDPPPAAEVTADQEDSVRVEPGTISGKAVRVPRDPIEELDRLVKRRIILERQLVNNARRIVEAQKVLTTMQRQIAARTHAVPPHEVMTVAASTDDETSALKCERQEGRMNAQRELEIPIPSLAEEKDTCEHNDDPLQLVKPESFDTENDTTSETNTEDIIGMTAGDTKLNDYILKTEPDIPVEDDEAETLLIKVEYDSDDAMHVI